VKKISYAERGNGRGVLVTARLPAGLAERIDAIAKADGITRSGATRKAIETGLKQLQRKAPAKRSPKAK
jgi:metal-responsive CopG/Arc/MetJ family transcriptional regulator